MQQSTSNGCILKHMLLYILNALFKFKSMQQGKDLQSLYPEYADMGVNLEQ